MALQKSADDISNILESMGEGFFAFDHEWACTFVNEKAVALTGTPRVQLLGKKLWELVPRGVGGRLRALMHRVATRKVPVQFEQHYVPLDAWFEVSAYPTRDGLAVFARDVTERKRFQGRMLQTQKLKSLGLLAGGIAHDFNNLLTGIIGNAGMLLEDPPKGSPMKGSLEDVVSASLRAGALTQATAGIRRQGPLRRGAFEFIGGSGRNQQPDQDFDSRECRIAPSPRERFAHHRGRFFPDPATGDESCDQRG